MTSKGIQSLANPARFPLKNFGGQRWRCFQALTVTPRLILRTFLFLSTLLLPSVAGAAEPASSQTQPSTDIPTTQLSEFSPEQVLVMRMTNTQLDPYLRMAAASDLIRRNTSAAANIIRTSLQNNADISTQRAILNALVDFPNPPRELAIILLDMFDKADASLLTEIAWALGRYDDHLLLRDLTSLAENPLTPLAQRRGAILTLGHHRTMVTARLLVTFIEPDQPELIRQAAFVALGDLSSQPELGQDVDAWRQWWQENQRLTPARWDAQLLGRFAHRTETLERLSRQAVDRLVESQRQLLRVTSHADRSALLAGMLQDPMEPIRRLAVEQLDQRARSGESTDAALRQGLIQRLEDVSPAVRLAAARLLRNLRDEAGSRDRVAHVAAQKLASMDETDEEVLRAYLLILTDTPVQSAVDRQIELLRNAHLRADAAGAITSAIDRKLVNESDMSLLRTMFARLAPDDQPPEPKLIELLGRVGGEKDWQRIAGWLENPDERIRMAAARAWAQSDRPMAGLAPYAKVPALLPIIIDAAYRRGNSTAVLMELVRNKPQQDQLAQSWQAALVAMAGRVTPQAVLAADAQLARQEESLMLRAAFVGAGVTAMESNLAAATHDPPDSSDPAPTLPTLVDLYLHDARLLLGAGSAESAWGQLAKLEKLSPPLSVQQTGRLGQLKLEVLAATGDLEGAILQSNQMLLSRAALPVATRAALARPMLSLFFNWTDRSITTSQLDQAHRILQYVRSQFGSLLTPDNQARLLALEAALESIRHAPASQAAATIPAPSTSPATQPATPASTSAPVPEPVITPSSMPISNAPPRSFP